MVLASTATRVLEYSEYSSTQYSSTITTNNNIEWISRAHNNNNIIIITYARGQ
jgi:hypothetical protein